MASNDLFPDLDDTQEFINEDLKSQIKNSNYVNQDTTPDFEADTIRLAKEINMPQEFVKRNYDVLKKDKTTQMPDPELDDLVNNNPNLAQFMADPQNNAVAKDDLENLKQQENLFKTRGEDSKFFGMLSGMNAQLMKGIATLPETAYRIGAAPVNLVTQVLMDRPDLELKPEQLLGRNAIFNYYDGITKKVTAQIPELQINVGDMAARGEFKEMSKGIAYQATLNAPNSIANMVVNAYSGPAAATAYLFSTTFGTKAKENEKTGASELSNVYNSTINAAAETLLERVSDMEILKAWGAKMAPIIGKQKTAEVIKEAGKTIIKSYGIEGGTELLTEGFQSGTDYATGVNPNALDTIGSDMLGAGLIGGFSGAAFSSPTAAAIVMQKSQAINSAENDKNFFEQLGELVSGSKLRERGLSDKNKFYLDTLTKDQATDTVYIDSEKLEEFFQSRSTSISEVFSQLGLNKEYENYAASGGDISLKTSDFVDKFVGTEFYQAISGDIKFNAEGVTYNQAVDDAKVTQETMKSIMQDLEKNPDRVAAAQQMEADLIAAGTPKETARQQASLSVILPVLAERTGKSLESLQQEYGVKIVKAEASVSGELLQEIKLPQAQSSELGFYSKMEQTIIDKVPNNATPEQIRATLKEIKPEELKYSGLDSFLKGKGKVSKQELIDFVRASNLNIQEVTLGEKPLESDEDGFISDGATKFSGYKLPGGESYREVLFTLPPQKTTSRTTQEIANDMFNKNFDELSDADSKIVYNEYLKDVKAAQSAYDNQFKSSHFDQKNILAHVRLDDRVDSDGKKVLFVEEIQSDWHQAGRKKGYKFNETSLAKEAADLRTERDQIFKDDPSLISTESEFFDDLFNKTDEELAAKYNPNAARIQQIDTRVGEIEKELRANNGTVPDAPFKKNWHEFAFKRILRMAADGGYDRVSWTTGEQQAVRYPALSDVVNSMEWITGKNSGTKSVLLDTKKAGEVTLDLDGEGKVIGGASQYKGKFLDEIIGKEPAKQIADSPDGFVNAKDIVIGGEGMKGFYDKILVDYANKIGKKFGVNVVDSKVVTGVDDGKYEIQQSDVTDQYYVVDAEDGGVVAGSFEYETEDGAQRAIDRISKKQFEKVHTLDITPDLVTQVSQGQELFQTIRGSYNPITRIIKLFQAKDKSTFLHESAHFFLDVLTQEALMGDAQPALKQDFAAILKYLGVESADKIETIHHEKFARGFEAYLREGVAPSLSLQKAFSSFKKWLTNIYKKYTINGVAVDQLEVEAGFKITLNDDIRGVFDRMLATDGEIDEARKALDIKRTLTPDIMATLGYTKEQIEEILTANEEWILAAEGKLYSKLEAQAAARKSREYTALVDKLTEDYKLSLSDNPIYKVIDALDGGLKVLESTASGLNNYTSKTEGLPIEVLAEMFGFNDAQELISLLNSTQNLETEARAQADIDASEQFSEVGIDIKSEATEALHNSKREDYLRLELENILKSKQFKDAIKKTVRRVPPKSDIKILAKSMIGAVRVGELKTYLYTRAMVKNARLAGEALANGDIVGAAEYKYKEYLNHELVIAAQDAEVMLEKSLRKFKKLDKSNEDLGKTRDVDLINAAKSLLSQFGIGRSDKLKEPADYLKALKEYNPQKYQMITALIGEAQEGAGNYEQVSFDDFFELKTAVDSLIDLAKSQKTSEIDGKKVEFDTLKADLIGQISKHEVEGKGEYKKTADKFDQFKSKVASSSAALKRVEFWCDVMDLGDPQGPFKRYIFEPISQAATKYRLAKEHVMTEYKIINEKHKDIFTKDPIASDEIKFRFKNKGELLMALLHSGNESNKSKLLRGRGWGSVNEDGTLNSQDFDSMISRMISDGTLTKADFDYAQEIWNLLKSMKSASQKAHKEMFGYYFNEITSKEFVTPFGTYEGGYIPAKVDTFENEDAKIRQERSEFEEGGLGMSFMYPTTGKGFTKSRIDNYAAPLSLDLNMLAGHIDSSLRFTYIEPRIKEVAKMVYNKEFRLQLSAVDKNAGSEVLIPWLQRAASQQVTIPSTGYFRIVDTVAGYLRSSVAMQIMVGNFSNAMQQFTGVIVASSKVSPKHLLSAVYGYSRNFKDTSEFMLDKSDFMRSTQGSNVYETMQRIEEITTNPNNYESARDFAKKHTYFLQSATQNIVNTIVWTGAYNESVASGMTEAQAVKDADRAIRTTQGSVLAEDISSFEVGSPTYRLFTQFAGYFNMILNLNSSEIQKIRKTIGIKKGASKMFYVYMTAFMLPAVISDIIVKGMRGEFGGGEDDEEQILTWLDAMFGSQFRTATATVPIAGALLNTVYGKFTDKQFDDRLSLSPVISVVEGAAGIPAQIYKGLSKGELNEKRLVKDALMLVGIASSLPLAPIGKPLGYLIDVDSGKANPSGPLDFARGLISGQPGK